jgi:AbrB family looped-hinge helix DNA binding protein
MVRTMADAAKSTTTLSTKGQVILPAAIRRRHNWQAGTRLTVEDTADGVLLRPTPAFPPTTTEQVFGCLRYQGKAKTLEEMRDGVAAEVRRRHARGRY